MLDLDSPSNLPITTDTEWDYDQSVLKMRQLVIKWKNLSLEILRELHVAKVNLSAQGNRSDITGEKVGWGQYLNDIGLDRRTVHRWLSKYDAENDELTPDIHLPEEIEGDDVLPTTHSCPNCGYEF